MINVACAVIINENKQVLATQRSKSMRLPLKWEFPGGKVEQHETAQECLIREIKEELNIEIIVNNALQAVEHHYKEFSIHLMPFICTIKRGEIKLTEHANYVWLAPNHLSKLDWAAADIPVISAILNYLDL